MAVRARIDPVEKVTAAAVLGETLPERRAAAAQFAREGIDDAERVNQKAFGRVPQHTVTVDGRQGAPLETVNPDRGEIIVEFEIVSDLIKTIADMLAQRSPVVSGEYRRGHKLLADGKEVSFDSIPQAEEYVFINVVPYARKIEVGKTKAGRAFVIQVANRIYERTARDVRSKLGNSADIRFEYRTLFRSSESAPAIVVRYRKV